MPTPMKDEVDGAVVRRIAEQIAPLAAGFDAEAFTRSVSAQIESLELKGRIHLIADSIADALPNDYPTALAIVVRVAESGVGDWGSWALCSFVERHGVESPVASLDAMSVLTKQWSCEFAVRPFLDAHLSLTREYLRRWVLDEDEAVRRLASEGTRPLLPWGPRVPALTDDPQIGIEALTTLRHDRSETVRRSVANHLNDVSKAHPDLVVDLLHEWSADTPPVDPRLVRHALRTLIKRGHTGALRLSGFTTEPLVTVERFTCAPGAIALGDAITLDVVLTSTGTEAQRLVIDFVIHHVGAAGATRPKVMKWAVRRLAPGETVRLSKRRRIRPLSTRTYYPGRHRVDLQIAGRSLASTEFELSS